MKRKNVFLVILICLAISALFVGCNNETQHNNKPHKPKETTANNQIVKKLVVIKRIDTANKNISFMDVETGGSDTYTYSNGTDLFNKSGAAISIQQLKAGDIVDMSYEKNSLNLKKVQISVNNDVWDNGKVTSFAFDEKSNSMKIGQTMYYFTDDLLVFSNDEIVDVRSLNNTMDQLVVKGYKNQVVSIVVEKGHGYISLDGDTLFIDGLINVGNVLARKIEPDMLLPVTEGNYVVEAVNGKYKAEKKITIERDKETIVDFSDIPAIVEETGNLKFDIDVALAQLYIDNKPYNYASIVTLKTGKHKVKATASGYDDYEMELEVKPEYQVVRISLKKSDSNNETKPNNETTSQKPTTQKETTAVEGETYVSSKNDVTVAGPEGALVYFDGAYKGIAPIKFDMITGTHVISILHNNKINSYTVNLIEGADDVTYDFSDKQNN